MLKRGVIKWSCSPCCSNVVLIRKKDNTYRFCVDYRSMNEVTVRDAYPLPRINECLDSLSGMKWFRYLNVNSGFWQTGTAPDNIEKTDVTSLGLYQFTVMPFGLTNPPSTFLAHLKTSSIKPLNQIQPNLAQRILMERWI